MIWYSEWLVVLCCCGHDGPFGRRMNRVWNDFNVNCQVTGHYICSGIVAARGFSVWASFSHHFVITDKVSSVSLSTVE